jgi:hypothetical protein
MGKSNMMCASQTRGRDSRSSRDRLRDHRFRRDVERETARPSSTVWDDLLLVFVSGFCAATVLSVVRWAEDYHLFILGALSFTAAFLGRTARRQGSIRLHITAMGLSYILLLTAFYVDNGHSLPLWKELPPIAYWLLPGALGIPIIIRALTRHPLARKRKELARGSAA